MGFLLCLLRCFGQLTFYLLGKAVAKFDLYYVQVHFSWFHQRIRTIMATTLYVGYIRGSLIQKRIFNLHGLIYVGCMSFDAIVQISFDVII